VNLIEKYKVLALCVLIKHHTTNSVIPRKIPIAQYCKQIGISFNTFAKYRAIARKEGFFIGFGNTERLIKIVTIIDALDIDITRHHRFFREEYEKGEKVTFKKVYERILQSYLMVNYQSQQYKIDKKKHTLELLNQLDNSFQACSSPQRQIDVDRQYKSLKRKYKGDSIKEIKSRISKGFNDRIVTGSYHAANLIGVSHTTANKKLWDLHNRKKLHREVVESYLPEYNSIFAAQWLYYMSNLPDGKRKNQKIPIHKDILAKDQSPYNLNRYSSIPIGTLIPISIIDRSYPIRILIKNRLGSCITKLTNMPKVCKENEI
jgi:hypothetical protein